MKIFLKEIFLVLSAKLMVFNTGLFQRNKQTAMNGYFIKNLKKRVKKSLNSGSLSIRYGAREKCSLSYLMKIRLVVLLSVPVLREVFPEILL
ncbi:MAG: hypothetical protein CM1200mP28_12720 [Deltaproteobacteria bacterium]|nr:MAG: hypothetical protein CM1200mP28_12720 [Deltaproteobacteria bacterium]